MNQDMPADAAASFLSQIKSLEAQIGALKARLLRSAENAKKRHTFAELYGRLADSDSSEAAIDSVLYRHPAKFEEEG